MTRLVLAALAALVVASPAHAQFFAPLAGTRAVQRPSEESLENLRQAQQRYDDARTDALVEALAGGGVDGTDRAQFSSLIADVRAARTALTVAESEAQAVKIRRWIPVLETTEAATAFFLDETGGASARGVSSAGLSLVGEGDTQLFVEFVTDNASLGALGWARVGFGALVQSGTDEPEARPTLDALLTNGGNASFNVLWPLAHIPLIPVTRSAGAPHVLHLSAMVSPRVGLTLPALGGEVQDVAGDIAGDVRASYETIASVFRINAGIRGGRVIAGTSLYESVGADGGFGYAQFNLSVDIAERFRLGFRQILAGPQGLRDGSGAFTLQVLPQPKTAATS